MTWCRQVSTKTHSLFEWHRDSVYVCMRMSTFLLWTECVYDLIRARHVTVGDEDWLMLHISCWYTDCVYISNIAAIPPPPPPTPPSQSPPPPQKQRIFLGTYQSVCDVFFNVVRFAGVLHIWLFGFHIFVSLFTPTKPQFFVPSPFLTYTGGVSRFLMRFMLPSPTTCLASILCLCRWYAH